MMFMFCDFWPSSTATCFDLAPTPGRPLAPGISPGFFLLGSFFWAGANTSARSENASSDTTAASSSVFSHNVPSVLASVSQCSCFSLGPEGLKLPPDFRLKNATGPLPPPPLPPSNAPNKAPLPPPPIPGPGKPTPPLSRSLPPTFFPSTTTGGQQVGRGGGRGMGFFDFFNSSCFASSSSAFFRASSSAFSFSAATRASSRAFSSFSAFFLSSGTVDPDELDVAAIIFSRASLSTASTSVNSRYGNIPAANIFTLKASTISSARKGRIATFCPSEFLAITSFRFPKCGITAVWGFLGLRIRSNE
mmetsp:Transcript_4831/g.7349  ORF Transcript_4831/g.7349 Transcript_4831/m.7349 type:complete len:305 (-) Transcript_4831:2181-3095(-)